MAVDRKIDQAVDKRPRSVGEQGRRRVPPLEHLLHRQATGLADRDEGLRQHEGRDLTGVHGAGLLLDPHGVEVEEHVVGVAVELWALMLGGGVLDRQRVQAELLAEHGEVVHVGLVQVQPHHRAGGAHVVADLGHREALAHELPVLPQAGARLHL